MPQSLLWRSQLRYLRSRPWLLAMAILGVAVGVAGVLSIWLTVYSSQRAFEHTTEALSGSATHVLEGPLTDAQFVRVSHLPGVRAAPIVEGVVATRDQRWIRLLGLDPFSESDFRTRTLHLDGDFVSILASPGAIALTSEEAERLHVQVGSVIELSTGARLHVTALLHSGDNVSQALRGVCLCDIATAQEVLGKVGELSRIDIIATGPLPDDLHFLPAGKRAQQLQSMTAAFFMNLQALSMLSLLVGALLVYNTVHFLVIQRQPTWQRLRTFGVTRRELQRQICGEALALGAVGSALGILLGWLLARVLLKMVSQTINDLYYRLEVSHVALSPGLLLECLGVGLLTTLAASLAATQALTHDPPRQLFSRSSSERASLLLARRAGLIGLICLGGGQLVLLSPAPLPICLGAVFLGLVGLALLTPIGVLLLNRAMLQVVGGFLSPSWRLSLRSVERSLSRTGVALAALSLALSATVAVGEMVSSFRLSLDSWLEQTLQADIYLSFRDREQLHDLPPDLVDWIRSQPGVAAASTARFGRIELNGRSTRLFATDLTARGRSSYTLLPGSDWSRGVFLSQPLQSKTHLRIGDPVELRSAGHAFRTQVGGVFIDYASEQGFVLLDGATYRREFGDTAISGIGVYLSPGADLGAMMETLERRCAPLPARPFLSITSNREIKEISRTIFARTFQVTGVLRWLAMLVAATATISALSALHIEKKRELAIWEALGMTRGERLRHIVGQVSLLGLYAGLLAIPYGILQSWWMTAVINPRAFGWNIPLVLDGRLLAEAPLLSLAAAWCALPFVWRIVQQPGLCERIREE